MKLIIAGTRTFKVTREDIVEYLEKFGIHIYDVTQVVSGTALGVDLIGEEVAHVYLSDKPDYLKQFYPDWDTYGKRAGPIRNAKMAAHADALLLIWDGSSPGSKNMKEEMFKLKKPVYEIIIRSHNVAR